VINYDKKFQNITLDCDFVAGERKFVEFLGGDDDAEQIDARKRQNEFSAGAQ